MVVADCHGVKWKKYKDLIDLYEFPSLQWNFTNQFGDPVYPKSSVCMSRIDAWLMMYGKKQLLLSLATPTVSFSCEAGTNFNDMAEALRFQGVMRLETCFEFWKRDEL